MRWCVRFFGVRSVEGAVNSQVVPIARFMKIPIGCHLHRFLFLFTIATCHEYPCHNVHSWTIHLNIHSHGLLPPISDE